MQLAAQGLEDVTQTVSEVFSGTPTIDQPTSGGGGAGGTWETSPNESVTPTSNYMGDINGINTVGLSFIDSGLIGNDNSLDSVGLGMFDSGSEGGAVNMHFLGGGIPVPLE